MDMAMQTHEEAPSPPHGDPLARLIRRDEVERRTGLSRSAIYHRNLHDPDWPKPIRIGPNTVAWLESSVSAWIQRQVEAARSEAA